MFDALRTYASILRDFKSPEILFTLNYEGNVQFVLILEKHIEDVVFKFVRRFRVSGMPIQRHFFPPIGTHQLRTKTADDRILALCFTPDLTQIEHERFNKFLGSLGSIRIPLGGK